MTNISSEHAFRDLLSELHAEMLTEDEDPAAEARADALRDQMDSVWWQLTTKERAAMRELSAELYEDEPPNLDPMDRSPELSMIERLARSPRVTKSSNPLCSVLGCKLPRNEQYREAAGSYFCWCTMHGEWYAARKALDVEWGAKIAATGDNHA